ncbi:MAG TPA: transglycosylase family protein [Pseudonocardiaceae bacterium]|nr:transglycosylase family protein [Pseudonocardiaceae bacterium]
MTMISRFLACTGIIAATMMSLLLLAAPAQAASLDHWDRLAWCESSGNWRANTGNGYYGGLQFSHKTWTGFGGGAYASTANHATRGQQIAIARKVLLVQGWKAWPTCSRKIGLR